MTESTDSTDPFGTDARPELKKALDLVGRTLAGVRADQYGDATPCPEYDVRTLSSHLVSVLRRVSALGSGGDFFSVPHIAEDVPDGGWVRAWDDAVRDAVAVWSDDALLKKEFKMPWGAQSGSATVASYISEFILHTWDLAKATGQQPGWDQAVVAGLVATMHEDAPAQPRGNPVPFGPVVEVPDDASDIDKLAGWFGRKP
ncbi:TIGR03086 family metal-binding protein [Streptomyces sp. H27-C3]|uniref:TIGR03086 family metal-binding protein n=1 Tax=Streptomyces sp. H27-C3 TaxID=3046305 RepID=UPI0024BA8B7F|nr:TIGR03086 family metal-binding protein [Streptomyces sp. H27-C3]MDJ0466272.1 TIGR03086 family metal-binding protein [Streptomyces sp. H27-C3]